MRQANHIFVWLLHLVSTIAFSSLTKVTHPHIPAVNNQRNIVVLSHNVSQDVADGFFDVNSLLNGRVDVLARCVNSALWVSNGIRKDTRVFLMLFPHNITIEVRGSHVLDLNPDERTTALCLQRTLLIGNNRNRTLVDSTAASEDRRDVELIRLRETRRGRPETVNPNKPGSLSKSEKRALRVTRKAREAMVRRIHKSSGDGVAAPRGFLLHRADTLEGRLRKLRRGSAEILVLNELGEPLRKVLAEDASHHNDGCETDDESETTIILGDQMGYAACDEKLLTKCDAVRQVSLGPLSLLTSQCITIAHHYLDTRDAALVESEILG